MSRRLSALLLVPILVLAFAVPVGARSAAASSTHIIAQKSSKKGARSVYLAHGLSYGHKYRIEIVSTGKYSISGYGFQNYTYVSHRQLVQGMKPFSVSGKTPYSNVITAPVSARLTGWSLTAEVTITGKHRLTVRYRDLGKSS